MTHCAILRATHVNPWIKFPALLDLILSEIFCIYVHILFIVGRTIMRKVGDSASTFGSLPLHLALHPSWLITTLCEIMLSGLNVHSNESMKLCESAMWWMRILICIVYNVVNWSYISTWQWTESCFNYTEVHRSSETYLEILSLTLCQFEILLYYCPVVFLQENIDKGLTYFYSNDIFFLFENILW